MKLEYILTIGICLLLCAVQTTAQGTDVMINAADSAVNRHDCATASSIINNIKDHERNPRCCWIAIKANYCMKKDSEVIVGCDSFLNFKKFENSEYTKEVKAIESKSVQRKLKLDTMTKYLHANNSLSIENYKADTTKKREDEKTKAPDYYKGEYINPEPPLTKDTTFIQKELSLIRSIRIEKVDVGKDSIPLLLKLTIPVTANQSGLSRIFKKKSSDSDIVLLFKFVGTKPRYPATNIYEVDTSWDYSIRKVYVVKVVVYLTKNDEYELHFEVTTRNEKKYKRYKHEDYSGKIILRRYKPLQNEIH